MGARSESALVFTATYHLHFLYVALELVIYPAEESPTNNGPKNLTQLIHLVSRDRDSDGGWRWDRGRVDGDSRSDKGKDGRGTHGEVGRRVLRLRYRYWWEALD